MKSIEMARGRAHHPEVEVARHREVRRQLGARGERSRVARCTPRSGGRRDAQPCDRRGSPTPPDAAVGRSAASVKETPTITSGPTKEVPRVIALTNQPKAMDATAGSVPRSDHEDPPTDRVRGRGTSQSAEELPFLASSQTVDHRCHLVISELRAVHRSGVRRNSTCLSSPIERRTMHDLRVRDRRDRQRRNEEQRDRARRQRTISDRSHGRGPEQGHRRNRSRPRRTGIRASTQRSQVTGNDRANVRAVGLDTPGPASAEGVISSRGATNFSLPEWWGFDVRGALEPRLGIPVVYSNDGNAAGSVCALRILRRELLRRSSVSAIVGTGLGGGVIESGRSRAWRRRNGRRAGPRAHPDARAAGRGSAAAEVQLWVRPATSRASPR